MGEIVRVSTSDNGSEVFDYLYDQKISADGRYVAFLSTSKAIEPGIPNDGGAPNVGYWFIKDTQTGQLARVAGETFFPDDTFPFFPNSFKSNYDVTLADGVGVVTYGSFAARFSLATGEILNKITVPDASDFYTTTLTGGTTKYVYSLNQSFNVTTGEVNERFGQMNIVDTTTSASKTVDFQLKYYNDKQDGGTRLSVNEIVSFADASKDGRYVLLQISATMFKNTSNGVEAGSIGVDYGIYDTQTNSFKRLTDTIPDAVSRMSASTPFLKPSPGQDLTGEISDNGKTVVFSSTNSSLVTNDTNGTSDVFAVNTSTGVVTRISTDQDGKQLSGDSAFASISGDGRYVLFVETKAYVPTLYVRDLTTGKVAQVNIQPDGKTGDASINKASISADGKYITFISNDGDYVTGDNNNWTDVFRLDNPLLGAQNSAPTITSFGGKSSAAATLSENQTSVASLKATDADGDALSWTISGGKDAGLFSISKTGRLEFKTAPDFETPRDADGNNKYEVVVRASDGSTSDTQSLSIAVENIAGQTKSGGSKSDTFIGGGEEDKFQGLGGDDRLEGLGGNDRLFGGDNNDTLLGGDGNDVLSGGSGRDRFFSGLGADRLSGGATDSTASDGARDDFIYSSIKYSGTTDATRDTIYGYFSGTNGDRIDLSGIDANGSKSGDGKFTFIGSANLGSNDVSQVQVKATGVANQYMVKIDIDGDNGSEMQILVHSTSVLTATDFIL